MGTAAPTGAFCGTCMFTCVAPAIRPGAWPAKTTGESTEPIIALTPAIGAGKGGVNGPSEPSAIGGFSEPTPVIYTDTIEPRAAGLVDEFTLEFWFRTAAWPPPLALIVKMPGTATTTGSWTGPSVSSPAWTVTNVGIVGITSNGTTALIWQLDAYRTVAGNWPKLTAGLVDPKPLPNRVTISPGATAPVRYCEA